MARPIGRVLNFLSYFNPVSSKHHALADFKQLKQKQKVTTIALSFLATVATLPLFGLGGVAAFRLMTRKYKVIPLNQGNERVDAVNDLYVKVMVEHLKSKQGVTGIQEVGPIQPATQDQFFVVLAKALNLNPEVYLEEFIHFVNANPDGVKEIFEDDGFFDPCQRELLSLNQFRQLLISSNVPRDAQKAGISPFVELQIALTKSRAQVTTIMKNVSIAIYEVSVMHIDSENGEAQVADDDFSVYPEISSAIKVEIEKSGQPYKLTYSTDNPIQKIEVANGRVCYKKTGLLPIAKQIYIQPQIVETK